MPEAATIPYDEANAKTVAVIRRSSKKPAKRAPARPATDTRKPAANRNVC